MNELELAITPIQHYNEKIPAWFKFSFTISVFDRM